MATHDQDANAVTQEEKMDMASSFVLQSPPGEINDVLNDIRVIIADDNSLELGVSSAIVEYNVTQLTTVEVPGQKHQTIICEAGRLMSDDPNEARFLDPRSKTSFAFDHISLKASDPRPETIDEEKEAFRAALEHSALQYVEDHYATGVVAVFSDPESPRYIIVIVANKYNAASFWSGRWRSQYVVDLENGEVTGKVGVHVHYYEQGNVQLQTDYAPILTLPDPPVVGNATTAGKILRLIESQEGDYQTSLAEVYHDIGEKTFKSLRRTLPLTRQKLDWDKVLGYKLGAELSASNPGRFQDAS